MSETVDTLLAGKIVIHQPEKGFRASTDSLLLAGAIPEKPGGHYLDVGCGCGGALLPAAWRLRDARFTGLDIDAEMAKLAAKGVAANHWSDRIKIETGEVSAWAASRENTFDCVFSNPPYFEPGKIVQPGEGREDAYLETIPLDDWLKAMMFVAKPRASIIVIHRAAELARILAALDRWVGELTVLPIAPFLGEEANRVLVRGRKGLKRGRVRLLAPFHVRERDGTDGFSPSMRAVQSGGALDW
ncbi:MAG: methyltransferase domain-containing protein [Pseudomonadota bacterium]